MEKRSASFCAARAPDKERCVWRTILEYERKMINPPVVDPTPDPDPEPEPTPDPDPTPDVKSGIVAENGSLYYYVDGVLTGAGLIRLNGDYYYVKTSNCEVVHGRSYWVTDTNGLLPAGPYTFDADGKMVK